MKNEGYEHINSTKKKEEKKIFNLITFIIFSSNR